LVNHLLVVNSNQSHTGTMIVANNDQLSREFFHADQYQQMVANSVDFRHTFQLVNGQSHYFSIN
jgi:hypothetical protein